MLNFKKPLPLAAAILGASAFTGLAACSTHENRETGSDAARPPSSRSSGSTTTARTGPDDGSIRTVSAGEDNAARARRLIDDQSAITGSRIAMTALAVPPGARLGSWYTYGSNAAAGATITPAPGAPFEFTTFDSGPFPHAACVQSPGLVGVFAGEGFTFATVIGKAARPAGVPLDMHAFTGLTFWATSTLRTWIRVRVQDHQTDGLDPTAICHHANAGGCDDDFSADNVPLGSAWSQILVHFSDLTQNNLGAQFPELDVQHVLGVRFEVEGSADGGDVPFQFCVAQIAFTK
ncbi:MAG: hypothetical protein ABSF69_12960 [Polyangiaceae bacterium]|jgi:hypothetical protein